MNKLLEPLTQEELARLDHFLQEHAAEAEESDPDCDPGVLGISELDGMVTALASAPTLAKAADWVPAVWGDEEPAWRDEGEFNAIVQLLQRHLNTVADTLLEAPDEFQPLFLHEDEDDVTYTIVDDWCEGYLRGVNLAAGAWNTGKADMHKLLAPILAFSSETDWRGHELPEAESDKLSDAIAPNAVAIHAYWRSRRVKD